MYYIYITYTNFTLADEMELKIRTNTKKSQKTARTFCEGLLF